MKDIRKFILEKQDWWTGKDAQLINKNDLINGGKEGDICDRLWMHIWDFLDELR